MQAATFLSNIFKTNPEFWISVDIYFQSSFQLVFHQIGNQSEAERGDAFNVEIFRKSHPIVSDAQMNQLVCVRKQPHPDDALTVFSESVFQRIGNQFIDNQTTGRGDIQGNSDRFRLKIQMNSVCHGLIAPDQTGTEFIQIRFKIDMGQIFGLIEHLVGSGYRHDPVLCFLE